MRLVSLALAVAWMLLLAGVGMHWPALAWGAGVVFCAFGGLWLVLFARPP